LSASVVLRLRLATQSFAATVHPLFLSVRAMAMSAAYFAGRAIGTSVTLARHVKDAINSVTSAPSVGERVRRLRPHAEAAVRATSQMLHTGWVTAAASRARLARHVKDAVNAVTSAPSVGVKVRRLKPHAEAAVRAASQMLHAGWVTAAASRARLAQVVNDAINSISAPSVGVRVRGLGPRAEAAVRLAGRMLHPRSVAVAGAMLALIAIAGPANISDMSAGRSVAPTEPAAAVTEASEPAVRAPKMVDVGAPNEERSSTPQATAANAAVATTAVPPVASPSNRSARLDSRAIQAVLNRYRDAVSTLDVTAVRSVWPEADVDALRKEFAGVREQNLEFEGCRISSAGAGALAACAGVMESGFKPGDRRPRIERRRWQFTLQRSARGWRIVEVLMQQG
jgi:hypothetical protein